MEKKIAYYQLNEIKELISKKQYVVTLSARQSYTALGLDDHDVMSVIEKLKLKDFYKSMTSYHDHQIWHDVFIVVMMGSNCI